MEKTAEALRLQNITKVYPNGVIANNGVTFSVNYGEIHALSGENGAGKTTLMKILFGEEEATDGEIYIDGEKVRITSPLMAIKMGIGLVHQHFMLVPSLTVAENMVLGIEPRHGLSIDVDETERLVKEASQKFNFSIDPNKKIRDLTVGQKQKVEILKALIRGAKILILDEPTAVLTPQETKELFIELKVLKEKGYTIIFISHKLNEVKELCDRITIIRHGRTMGVYNLSEISEQEISRLMVGRDVALEIIKKPPKLGKASIKVRDLKVIEESGKYSLKGISLTAHYGEIFGVAGVEGNGQLQLAEALTGMGSYQGGTIELDGKEISRFSIGDIRSIGVSHIPEDRMVSGVAPHLSVAENVIADKLNFEQFVKNGFLRSQSIRKFVTEIIKRYKIACQSPDVSVDSLSGGNIQKVVLARELSSEPKIIIAEQPTRGVDVGATEFIRNELLASRDAGNTVFLISSDLNEILGLSDSLIVLYDGEIVAFFPDASKINEEDLGRYMLGIERQSFEQISEAYSE